MKKYLWFMLLISGPAYAWQAPDYLVNFTNDTKTVTLSTTAASPTQLCAYNVASQRTYIVNSSSFSIAISSSSTGISTTTSFLIPSGATVPVIWSPDGVNSPYIGPLFGLAPTSAITPPSVSIYRGK